MWRLLQSWHLVFIAGILAAILSQSAGMWPGVWQLILLKIRKFANIAWLPLQQCHYHIGVNFVWPRLLPYLESDIVMPLHWNVPLSVSYPKSDQKHVVAINRKSDLRRHSWEINFQVVRRQHDSWHHTRIMLQSSLHTSLIENMRQSSERPYKSHTTSQLEPLNIWKLHPHQARETVLPVIEQKCLVVQEHDWVLVAEEVLNNLPSLENLLELIIYLHRPCLCLVLLTFCVPLLVVSLAHWDPWLQDAEMRQWSLCLSDHIEKSLLAESLCRALQQAKDWYKC